MGFSVGFTVGLIVRFTVGFNVGFTVGSVRFKRYLVSIIVKPHCLGFKGGCVSSVAVRMQGGCVSAHAAVIATVQAPVMLCSNGAC